MRNTYRDHIINDRDLIGDNNSVSSLTIPSEPINDQNANEGALNNFESNNNVNGDNDDHYENNDESMNFKNIFFNETLISIASLNGMFDKSLKNENHLKCQKAYKIIISLIIISLQLYSIIYMPLHTKVFRIPNFLAFLIFKLICIYKNLAFNFIDLLINGKNTIKTLKGKKERVVLYITVIIYITLFIIFIVIYSITKESIFPNVKSASYTFDDSKWFKFNEYQTISPKGFCYAKAPKDGSLNTVDFSMLATLPRLYGINKEGRCYIKPSMIGLFNTTMKYIFGKDYEKDEIQILCKKMTKYPMLVITSDKILNNTLTYFNDDNITILEKQFKFKNNNYFENYDYYNHLNNESKSLFDSYVKCKNDNKINNVDCDYKWDLFTQYYWSHHFTDEFTNIDGLESYQITINDSTIIQPSFITSGGQLWSGTRYFIGGGYEDKFGIGFLIENLCRKNSQFIFENFLILYSYIRSVATNVFMYIESLNSIFFPFNMISLNEMTEISNLYSQFNCSNQTFYAIGHSISGTAFKGISYIDSIQGISFEGSDSRTNVHLNNKKITSHGMKFHFGGSHYSQMTNIFTKNSFVTGFDDNCDVNGILPPRYNFPNVYETACMTAISCSETMKYVPFCKQVLNKKGKNPESEFNKSLEEFQKYYFNH